MAGPKAKDVFTLEQAAERHDAAMDLVDRTNMYIGAGRLSFSFHREYRLADVSELAARFMRAPLGAGDLALKLLRTPDLLQIIAEARDAGRKPYYEVENGPLISADTTAGAAIVATLCDTPVTVGRGGEIEIQPGTHPDDSLAVFEAQYMQRYLPVFEAQYMQRYLPGVRLANGAGPDA